MDCARVKLVADAPHDKLLAFDARKSLEKRRDLCANHSVCVEAVESALAEYANDGDVRAIWVVLRVGDLRYPFLSMQPTLVLSTRWATLNDVGSNAAVIFSSHRATLPAAVRTTAPARGLRGRRTNKAPLYCVTRKAWSKVARML